MRPLNLREAESGRTEDDAAMNTRTDGGAGRRAAFRIFAASILVLIPIVASPGLLSARSGLSSGPQCPSRRLPDPVADPRQWTRQCLGAEASPESLTEFKADIDFDGIPELFLSSSMIRGNAGGDHYVFQKNGRAYTYLGSLFLHPLAFKVLPPEGDRSPRMILYHRSSAAEGTLETVKYDGREFIVVSRETIEPLGRDRDRYDRIFAPDVGGYRPEISADEALKIADAYIRENRIDLSLQYIHFVRLDYDAAGPKPGFYWRIHWRWTVARLGGEFGLRIYMDRTVVLEIAGS